MSVSSINSSVIQPSEAELQTEATQVSAAMAGLSTEEAAMPLSEELQSFTPLSLQAMSFSAMSDPATYTLDELGNNLIVFSKVEEAKKWAGASVDTIYFRMTKDGSGNIVLEPLKAVRAKEVNYSDISANKLTFVSAGAAVPLIKSMPSASEFLKLHSSEQTAAAAMFGTVKTANYPAPRSGSISYIELNLPADADQAATTAVLSQNRGKVYIVDKLQARDFSVMSYDDQLAISKTTAFNNIKTTLGLTGTAAEALAAIDKMIADIKAAFPDNIPAAIAAINADSSLTAEQKTAKKNAIQTSVHGMPVASNLDYDNGRSITYSGGTSLQPINNRIGLFTKDQRDLYLDQINIIRDEALNDMAVFNMTSISDKLKGVKDRFDRALAFGNIPVKQVGSTWSAEAAVELSDIAGGFYGKWRHHVRVRGYTDIISLDDNKTVREGFELFISQEKIYHENAKSRRDLIKNITQNNMTLDAPSLLYRLQIHYNVTSEADISCASEELRQQNDLMNSYSKMQQMISRTVGAAGKDNIGFLNRNWHHKKDIPNSPNFPNVSGNYPEIANHPDDIRTYNYLSNEELKIVSMFQNHNGKPNVRAPRHPLEVLRNITRPYQELYGNSGNGWGWVNKRSTASWQQVANQFSETSNLIGQETQNSTNKISGFEKDKARYTEMASNTLSKLNEIIIAIGRSL